MTADTNTPQPVTPFTEGQPVRVTPEYAAWYREHSTGYPSRIKPEDVLTVDEIEDDGFIRIRTDRRVPVVGWALPEYLVSAEENER